MLSKLLIAMLLLSGVLATFIAEGRRATAFDQPPKTGDHWQIKGSLSEACTCSVPCTCNFGEAPSPHSYCYAVYSYEIKEGTFNGIKLDGLRIGGMETAKGNAMYLDARARDDQRAALETIARQVLRVTGDRMGHGKFLGLKYVDIKQQHDDRHDALEIVGAGSFKTGYIMGRDKTRPVTVVNNTAWAIHEAIKGKTESFAIKDQYGNQYSATGTNSNHGDFEYDQDTVFEDHSCAASCAAGEKDEHTRHRH